MHDLVEQFLSMSTMVFCLAVVALVWIQRRLLEGFLPVLKNKETRVGKMWREMFVPLAPIGTGGIAGMVATKYPYPEMFTSFSSRLFFGLVCGLLSGLVYRLIKKNVMDKLAKPEAEANSK